LQSTKLGKGGCFLFWGESFGCGLVLTDWGDLGM
jgi:hypothetical protein